MLASRFTPPARPAQPAWKRHAMIAAVRTLGVPAARVLEAFGRWPDVLGRRIQRGMGRFGDYRPDAHDVIVCSWFKSGTNWMLQTALQIAFRGDADFRKIHDVVPWPDAVARMRPGIIPLDDPSPAHCSPTGLRVIKTHLPQAEVPYAPEARYLVVVRDPKDVCVSGYHFLSKLVWGPTTPSVARWVDYYLSPRFHVGSWAGHLAGYWRMRTRENVLFLTFEQLKRDGRAGVERIAEFMGVGLTPAELDQVVERASFGYMKAHASQFEAGQAGPWAARSGFMIRKGERGTSGELLSAEQRQRIDDHWRAELARLECDFPYDDLYRY